MRRAGIHPFRSLVALAATLGLFACIVGCGGTTSGTVADTDEYYGMEAPVAQNKANAASSEDATASGEGVADDQQAPREAVVIKTAFVELSTREYDKALGLVREVIGAADGEVTQSNESGGSSRTISIQARVNPDKLEETVEKLRGLEGCTVLSANVSADDVTHTYNDTERRIEILNEQYEHYKRMLEEAKTTEDMLQISDRMYDVMAEIKSYTDARDDMAHDADRSQLSVTLREESAVGEGGSLDRGDFASRAWTDSWGLFGEVVRSLVYLLIMLLPYLLVASAIVAIVVVVRRRRRAGKPRGEGSRDVATESTATDAPVTDPKASEQPDGDKAKAGDGPRPPEDAR